MNSEPINFAELLAQRKASAQQTLREISEQKLRALIAKLFPDGTHPWAESFASFIAEHQSERALQGETLDGIDFVYYPKSNRGIWYQYQNRLVGVGLLGEASLRELSEISGQEKKTRRDSDVPVFKRWNRANAIGSSKSDAKAFRGPGG